jgi:hypothetical protein
MIFRPGILISFATPEKCFLHRLKESKLQGSLEEGSPEEGFLEESPEKGSLEEDSVEEDSLEYSLEEGSTECSSEEEEGLAEEINKASSPEIDLDNEEGVKGYGFNAQRPYCLNLISFIFRPTMKLL